MKKRCLVTGGAGFIGSHITERLLREGYDVTVLDNLSTGERTNVPATCRFVEGDILNPKHIEDAFTDVEYVFHAAALPRIQPSFDDPVLHEEVNVLGTVNMMLAARKHQVKKFVFSSSGACYGTPTELPTTEKAAISCLSPYALQKYAAEQYCLLLGQRWDIPVIALRYFNVYGPRSFNPKNPFNAYSSVVGVFHHQHQTGQTLTITGDGEQSRDFVHVHDVAEGNLRAAFGEARDTVCNIGCGKKYTVNEIANMFSGKSIHIPERAGEARVTLADIRHTQKTLGWTPRITLEEGIKML